jgi:SAM-dependent methyltransferase
MLGTRILLSLSRRPGTSDYLEGTLGTDLCNSLSFLLKTVPDFTRLISNRIVLDYGCGLGWQALAMAKEGARQVVGIDIRLLDQARSHAEQYGYGDKVSFVDRLEPEMIGAFDVVLSCSSFEHLTDPPSVLCQMGKAARPGGIVIISFAEPWYSPHGSHMGFFTKLPWVNILFSESSVMEARSHFRSDGARYYQDVEGGLNRMTLSKFEKIIRNSGLRVEFLRYYPVKGLPVVGRIPVVRELFVAAAACILRKD